MICSVIIPCRNEVRFIRKCLDSILASDMAPAHYEILVADGMSTDGTRAILGEYVVNHPRLRIVDNPGRTAPAGLNLAIRASVAPVIIRVDAHSTIEPDYLRQCVDALESSGADNVGGVMHTHPMTTGRWSDAITIVLGHPFGVGNSMFRIHSATPQWVDTVFGGCYRREVFARIGYFNERLRRGQDMEFNRRLTAAGGRILLDPRIQSHYYARADLRTFASHNWANGIWAIYPFVYSDVMPVSLRHLVPLFFVSSLLGSAALALVWQPAVRLLAAIVVSYALLAIAAGVRSAAQRQDPFLAVLLPATFFMLHAGYGLGSLWALIRLTAEPAAWRRLWAWCRRAPVREVSAS